MTQTYFFQYNVPAENHFNSKPDYFVNVLCECDKHYFSNGDDFIQVMPIVTHKIDLISVKDWAKAFDEMERIAKQHFESINNAEVIGDLVINEPAKISQTQIFKKEGGPDHIIYNR